MKALHKSALAAGVVLLAVGGCSLLDPVEVATKTTTYYDEKGVKTHSVTDSHAIGDKYTEYRGAVDDIAESMSLAHGKAMENIKALSAPSATDDDKDKAYKSSMGFMATIIVADKYSMEEAISSLHYGLDKYDVSSVGIESAAELGGVIADKYADTKVLKYAFEAAGNKLSSITTGDGNSNEQTTEETISDINGVTSGDSAGVSISNPQKTEPIDESQGVAEMPTEEEGEPVSEEVTE